jgi:hypothetical protein
VSRRQRDQEHNNTPGRKPGEFGIRYECHHSDVDTLVTMAKLDYEVINVRTYPSRYNADVRLIYIECRIRRGE